MFELFDTYLGHNIYTDGQVFKTNILDSTTFATADEAAEDIEMYASRDDY